MTSSPEILDAEPVEGSTSAAIPPDKSSTDKPSAASTEGGSGPITSRWTSRSGMLLALVGSAVGIGNLVRFPYLVATFGGGTFILVYVLSTFFLALPMLMATLAAGRSFRCDAKGVYRKLGLGNLGDKLGYLLIVGMILNTVFLFIVASWGMGYIMFAAAGSYEGHAMEGYFEAFLDSKLPYLLYIIVVVAGAYVVAKGVGKGIERACRPMMVGLLILLILVLVRAMTFEGPEGSAASHIGEAFAFDSSALAEPKLWLFAIGHAFFSLSVGGGIMVTYGAYMSEKEDMHLSAWQITLADLGVALLAGLAILPASLAMGYEWGSGDAPSVDITFETLPQIFLAMPAGALIGAIFFGLVVIGALTSVFSTIEAVVAWLIGERKWQRSQAAMLVGGLSLPLGVGMAVSTHLFFGLDYFRAVIGIPITLGLIYAMMFGWGERNVRTEINRNARWPVPDWLMRVFKYAAIPILGGATILSFF